MGDNHTPIQSLVSEDEKVDILAESKKYGGASEVAFKDCIGFIEGNVDPDTTKPPKQVNVPVFLTLLVKRLEDDPDDDQKVIMSGTMIQRCLFVDLASVMSDEDPPSPMTNGFKVRVNEGPAADDETINLRKKVQVGIARMERPNTDYMARSITSSFRLPMRRVSLFFRQPFNIAACETLLELTSFTGYIPGKKDVNKKSEIYEFRPDLQCHIKDARNLIWCARALSAPCSPLERARAAPPTCATRAHLWALVHPQPPPPFPL